MTFLSVTGMYASVLSPFWINSLFITLPSLFVCIFISGWSISSLPLVLCLSFLASSGLVSPFSQCYKASVLLHAPKEVRLNPFDGNGIKMVCLNSILRDIKNRGISGSFLECAKGNGNISRQWIICQKFDRWIASKCFLNILCFCTQQTQPFPSYCVFCSIIVS